MTEQERVVDLCERLVGWSKDAALGRPLIGANLDIRESADQLRLLAMKCDALDRLRRNRDMWKGQCERQAAILTSVRAALGSDPA